jgi:hypothetical protein
MATKKLVPHSKDELTAPIVAKRNAYKAAPPHPGAAHVVMPGLLAKGLSKTQSARATGQDAIGEVNTPTLLKAGHMPGNVKNHPATPPRIAADCADNGGDVLSEAKK